MNDFQPVAPPAEQEAVSVAEISAGIREIARGILDEPQIRELVLNLYEMTKRKKTYIDRGGCKKCECKHFRWIEVDNVEGSLKAMDLLLNRFFGRPGTAAEDDSGVIVIRTVKGVNA